MHLFRLLVLVFITNVVASNCPHFDTDEGNFHRTCDTESFVYRSGMGITANCQRADLKTNISTILGLSKCLGYNTKENKLEWKIPPSCNATMTDERSWNNTQGQGNLSVLAS
ncbi:hypothetical protein QBC32DRAFT_216387 [Pseudoneurospora amorphoporcata]|uniref:Cyanovirin-N domain-containing protein n=1 Tax=Pseudoneurospora amorphoporcata TaxID=241081 RepID=A0AAN6NS47_9PEZI|nr:hypothetical protein QBC32DRAFT_216387 [Pseudoneurospora amorphoporcata]